MLATPDVMTTAATDLARLASTLDAAHKVAAAPTTAIAPTAADEVSTAVAGVFAQHAVDFHALAGQAVAFHDQFVHNLTAGAASYASAESAIVSFFDGLNHSTGLEGQIVGAIKDLLTIPFAILAVSFFIGLLLLISFLASHMTLTENLLLALSLIPPINFSLEW
jgi:PE family